MKEKIEGGIKKAKNKTHRIQILALQKSVIKIAIKLCDNRTIIINTFVNKHIYIAKRRERKFEETVAERTKLKGQRYSEIIKNEKGVNMELFSKIFNSLSLSQILKGLYNTMIKKGIMILQVWLKVDWVI